MQKEALARIKINKLLEAAGWRFFADGSRPASIQLEASVTITTQQLDSLGEDFENADKGYIDFLLLNEKGFPFVVLEAKSEDKNPLDGKEQSRTYARSQNCRFVILSNGNLHYFWDLERGNPYIITTFPTPTSVKGYEKVVPDPKRLIDEPIGADYIAGDVRHVSRRDEHDDDDQSGTSPDRSRRHRAGRRRGGFRRRESTDAVLYALALDQRRLRRIPGRGRHAAAEGTRPRTVLWLETPTTATRTSASKPT